MTEQNTTTGVSFRTDLLIRVDDVVHELKRRGDRKASRSGVISEALEQHLPDLEQELGLNGNSPEGDPHV